MATTTIGVGSIAGAYSGEIAPYSTGVTLPEGSTFVIRVTGKTHLIPNTFLLGANAQQVDIGPVAGTSADNDALRVLLQVGDYSAFWTPTLVPGDSFATADTVHIGYYPLNVYAKRLPITIGGVSCNFNRPDGDNYTPPPCVCPGNGGGPPIACDHYEGNDYEAITGSQTITFERLENDLTLTAEPAAGDTGRSVTFTAHVNNGTAGNLNQFIGWAFYPDDPSKPVVATCSNGTNPCVYTVHYPGRMRVMATFYNGIPTREAFAHVTANPLCHTGEDLLDSAAVRAAVQQVWDSTHAERGPLFAKEQGAYVFLDTVAHTISTVWDATTDRSVCHIKSSVPTVTNSKLVAEIHSHPSALGESVPAGLCPDRPNGYVAGFGPSRDDKLDVISHNAAAIVIDRDWVHYFDVRTYRPTPVSTQFLRDTGPFGCHYP